MASPPSLPPHPCEQLLEPGLRTRSEMLLPPKIHHFLVHLCLGWIGMDRPGNRLGSGAGLHRHGKLTDHLACVRRYDCGSKYLVRALLNVNPRETLFFSIEDRTIDLIELVGVSFDLDAILFCIPLIQPDMGNFRIRKGTPRHDE